MWLTSKSVLEKSEVIEAHEIKFTEPNMERDLLRGRYKLVVWNHLKTIKGAYEGPFLEYLNNGGTKMVELF